MRTSLAWLFAVVVGGCAAAQSGDESAVGEAASTSAALDVNDVSFLFPLPEKSADVGDLMGLDTVAANGPLLSKASFSKLISIALPDPKEDGSFHNNGFDDPKNWRIVAMRIDPCAKADPKDADCNVQLRLVAQAMESGKGEVGAADQAMHLIYQLDASESAPLVADVLALKTAETNGKPLGIHPVMAKEGLKGHFATGLKSIVAKYAGEKRMPFATVMLTLNAGLWRFGRGDMTPAGMVQAQVPFSPEKTIAFHGTTGVIGNFEMHVEPPATSKDNVNQIAESGGSAVATFKGPFFKLSSDDQKAAVESALRIDNPTINSVGTTDCVSCHHATRGLRRAKSVEFLNANDNDPNRYVPPAGVTTTYAGEVGGGEYAVRSFGYLGREVSYTQGTINSSAEVIRTISKR